MISAGRAGPSLRHPVLPQHPGDGHAKGTDPCGCFSAANRKARCLHELPMTFLSPTNARVAARCPLGAMRIKLTNMLSIFVDSLGQASNFQSVVINGCSPAASLIFLACLGKCLVSNKSSLCISCEEFKHSKSFAARARLLQIQIGADCLCRSRALATKAHRFRLVRLRFKVIGLTLKGPGFTVRQMGPVEH